VHSHRINADIPVVRYHLITLSVQYIIQDVLFPLRKLVVQLLALLEVFRNLARHRGRQK
jgi:hypothetical protein